MYAKYAWITQSFLIDLLAYNHETGSFTWKKRVSRRMGEGDFAGSFVAEGYRRIGIDGGAYRAHVLAWIYVYGSIPTNVIDHIDGDKANNRISNLRIATPSMNAQNLKRANRLNKSTGLLGVTRNKQGFQAQIQINGVSKYLGTFQTPEIAHERYLSVKRSVHEGCTI